MTDCPLEMCDADFIAAAREAVPALLEEVKLLRSAGNDMLDFLSDISNDGRKNIPNRVSLGEAAGRMIRKYQTLFEES